MKKIIENKKVLISIITALILIILIIGGIFLFSKDDKDKLQNKEITNDYLAYIKINPLIKIEYSQTCKDDFCNEPIVNKYELINDDAKDIYKDIDLIGTNNNLYNVISLISKTAEDNNIEFENVEIYSNWDNLNNYIDNSNKDTNKWSYIINIRDKENLEEISSSLEANKVLYNVEFETNGGTKINTQTIEKGKLVNEPTTPTKKGYTFIEWQLDGTKFDFNKEITSDIKLIAKWEKAGTTNNSNNNETTNNNTKPVKKAYLSFSDLYSMERVKKIEKKYNIKINLIAGAKCGYIEGGDLPLIESGKTYTVHINSLEPYVQGACGDASDEGGLGDATPNFCEEDFNSEDCINSLVEFYNDGKVMYDNKILWSTQGIALKRCYDAYSCANSLTVTIFNYNKNNINSIPTTHKKYIYDNYLSDNYITSVPQSNYDNVVKHNYVQSFETYLNNLKTILNKYEDYKNQGLIQNDDSTIPENLQECTKDTIGVDTCLSTINTVKGEISWTQDGLANAKSDLNYATQSLNSSKELLNLFN